MGRWAEASWVAEVGASAESRAEGAESRVTAREAGAESAEQCEYESHSWLGLRLGFGLGLGLGLG